MTGNPIQIIGAICPKGKPKHITEGPERLLLKKGKWIDIAFRDNYKQSKLTLILQSPAKLGS